MGTRFETEGFFFAINFINIVCINQFYHEMNSNATTNNIRHRFIIFRLFLDEKVLVLGISLLFSVICRLGTDH